MGLVEGNLYLVKRDKEWIVAMFRGYQDVRQRGMDWRLAKFLGPAGLFCVPASDTYLHCNEIPEAN
tara:strand:+ start:369 stop:566 length:198 start_codon:yes stop_codon:yes gene_type:complete